MAKISLDNAQKVDIIAKKNNEFVLNLDIKNPDGSNVVFDATDVLIFAIMDNDFNSILLASNVVLNTNSNVSGYEAINSENAISVARNISQYAGNNTILEISNYNTSIYTNPSDSQFESSIFYDNRINNTNSTPVNYIAVGNILVTSNNIVQVNFSHDEFDMPKDNYKYIFRSLRDKRSVGAEGGLGKLFSNVTTWLYGKIKINE
jgi:hypothetical protein|tara:strand:- start:100 stop:714 length:615 start_codon:yes stop_codon:yes gene_type:complete